RFLGVNREPTPDLVVKHLLNWCEKGKGVNQQVYVFLNQNADDASIDRLKGRSCLWLQDASGHERYFGPDEVFWEAHPFGSYRVRLDRDCGRFKTLYDQLGVKEGPDYLDAIAVLLEIEHEFGG